MELHFCSQCGISIPLAEVQSGAAKTPDGRTLCAEHRGGAKAAAASAKPSEVELLFCANCKVSIPAVDVESGRARREFGSLLCAPCSAADVVERDRRRKAVEEEMADNAPLKLSDTAEQRKCSVCTALVPQAQIAAGRALVEGNRVVCPRCREAGATASAPPARTHAASRGPGSMVLVGLLLVAVAVAGFFGMEYVQARTAKKAPTGPTEAEKQVADLRRDLDRRMAALETSVASRDDASAASKESVDAVQARLNESVLAVREDLAEVRNRLTTADGDLAQRIARLEGQIAGLQEMIKGLAARPSAEAPRLPTGPAPEGSGEGTRPPEGPAPEPPKPPVAGVQPLSPEVTKLLKDLLESPDMGVRYTAANELRRRKERAAIPAFAKTLLVDENVMVRRCAAAALGEIKAWYAVPALIEALEEKEPYVAQAANFAIQGITGQDFGVTMDHSLRDRKSRAANAAKWWEKNKDNPPDGVVLEPVALPTK